MGKSAKPPLNIIIRKSIKIPSVNGRALQKVTVSDKIAERNSETSESIVCVESSLRVTAQALKNRIKESCF